MVLWLEEFLNSFRGVLIMVTHDRYFLDRVTNKIVEIDKGKLYEYDTNYSGFSDRTQTSELASRGNGMDETGNQSERNETESQNGTF